MPPTKSAKSAKRSKPATVQQYLAALPPERRAVIQAVREVILANLPEGYQECMQYGMIGYSVPHTLYPPGYHCDPRQPLPFAGLAAQKNAYSLYLMCVYGNSTHDAWFRKAWVAAGKKLDMGKACVRFKRLEDVPLEVVGEAIRRVPVEETIAHYEAAILTMNKAATARRTSAAKAPKPVPPRSSAKPTSPKPKTSRASSTPKRSSNKPTAKKRTARKA